MKRLTTLAMLMAFASCAQANDDSLYQNLGGKDGIKKIVSIFVPMVQNDPRIKTGFDGVDIPNLKMRLEEQFCELAGGPCKYKGKDMQTIHDGLNITNAQFNALAEDLQISMEQVDVPAGVSNKLVAKLAPMQRDIVTK